MRFVRRRLRQLVYLAAAVLVLLSLGSLLGASPLGSPRDMQLHREHRYRSYLHTQANRTGPGEMGKGMTFHGTDQAELADELFKKWGYNKMASDLISLDRSVPDMRPDECRSLVYPEQLPDASVILVYHNEDPRVVLRTAHSVVNRTPPRMLREVILLDDASTLESLAAPLQRHLAEVYPDGVVRVVRSDARLGLVGARQLGADSARGDVLIFLDAHCEVNHGWAEPLLARIKEKPTAVLCPVIEDINYKSMQYGGGKSGVTSIGGFSWGLFFTWQPIPARDRVGGEYRTRLTDPVKSPTMAGGLFAMQRAWYHHLGGYDTGMEIWGGENLELSFRTWMCGGSLEFVPCSHVGHIFRPNHPYGFPSKTKDYHGLNSKRLADVWMDGYKDIFYSYRPDLLEPAKAALAGNVSARVELRRRLQCRSFRWYLTHVYPQLFIMDENVFGWGNVVMKVGVYPCYDKGNTHQLFSYTKKEEIRREDKCMEADSQGLLFLYPCHGKQGSQRWLHEDGHLVYSNNRQCVDVNGVRAGGRARLADCQKSEFQYWNFQHKERHREL